MKIAQETGESGGIIGNRENSEGIRGKLVGNSSEIGRKLGNCVSPIGKQNFLTKNLFPPHRGKRAKMRENCFTKIPIWGTCVKQVGGNEREMKGKFVFTTSFNYKFHFLYQYKSKLVRPGQVELVWGRLPTPLLSP